MLLSLPPELVEHIVRLLEPITITSKSYQQRQDILRALCLVSSALKEIAQPVIEEAAPWPGSWAESVRKERSEAEYRKLCRLSMHLEEVQLDVFDDFDLSCLSGCPHLRRLILNNCTLLPLRHALTRIVELTVNNTPVDKLFEPSIVLQLETLYFNSVHQLKDVPSTCLVRYECRVRANRSDYFYENMQTPRHLSLVDDLKDRCSITQWMEHITHLDPKRLGRCPIRAGIEEFCGRCRARGTRVEFEELDDSSVQALNVSPRFEQYAREERARRAVEE
ncbi:hypothetical protein JCM8547_006483 [Rhodosporidiobolus lusitaniae]